MQSGTNTPQGHFLQNTFVAKKLILILFCVFALSACTQNGTKIIDENNAKPQSSGYSESNLIKDINSTKNKKKSMEEEKQSSDEGIKLENLSATYSKAIMKTSEGDITLEFFAEESPKTVNNFLTLSKNGFYDGTKFHRVIKDFMIQGGDPLSKDDKNKDYWGTGGPGYKFEDEFNDKKLVKGSLAMANSGPNTNGSQFFIVTLDATPWLDGKHTNFGQVVEGLDIVEKIENTETDGRDRPIKDIIIESIELK